MKVTPFSVTTDAPVDDTTFVPLTTPVAGSSCAYAAERADSPMAAAITGSRCFGMGITPSKAQPIRSVTVSTVKFTLRRHAQSSRDATPRPICIRGSRPAVESVPFVTLDRSTSRGSFRQNSGMYAPIDVENEPAIGETPSAVVPRMDPARLDDPMLIESL